MKVFIKRTVKEFSELDTGDVFQTEPSLDNNTIYMKIDDSKTLGSIPGKRNAVNLETGDLWTFSDAEDVIPVSATLVIE